MTNSSSPTHSSRRKQADAKRDLALHALIEAKRSGLAVHDAAARIACDAWAAAEVAAGRAGP